MGKTWFGSVHHRVSGLHVLPLAFVMIAGVQILTSIFRATTKRWKVVEARRDRLRLAAALDELATAI